MHSKKRQLPEYQRHYKVEAVNTSFPAFKIHLCGSRPNSGHTQPTTEIVPAKSIYRLGIHFIQKHNEIERKEFNVVDIYIYLSVSLYLSRPKLTFTHTDISYRTMAPLCTIFQKENKRYANNSSKL